MINHDYDLSKSTHDKFEYDLSAKLIVINHDKGSEKSLSIMINGPKKSCFIMIDHNKLIMINHWIFVFIWAHPSMEKIFLYLVK